MKQKDRHSQRKRRLLISSEKGSMVVEASIVLPLFMFFVIFLIYMVQMTLVSTALQTTVSDAVKMVATHLYPISLAVEGGEQVEEQQPSVTHWEIPKLSLQDWADSYSSSLPNPINEWVREAAAAGDAPLQELKNETAETVLDPVVKPLLKPFMPAGLLEYDRLHVSNISVPNLRSGDYPYFGVEVSYELPIRVPFIGKEIVLQAKAQERLWIGDTGEESDSGTGDDESTAGVIELLEKPNPAYASRQARVRVKVEPGTSAQLSVYYKSGKSTAKYLGWKTADENGHIEWEWNVGFNTTPGTWPFVVETAGGEQLEVMFDVLPRP